MYRFPIVEDKKARSLCDGYWRVINNPLYQRQGRTQHNHLNGNQPSPIEPINYILNVYPDPCDYLGPFQLDDYEGTLISAYMQTDDASKPRYLIWIDRVDSGDVVFAHYITDLNIIMNSFALRLMYDLFVDVYQEVLRSRDHRFS